MLCGISDFRSHARLFGVNMLPNSDLAKATHSGAGTAAMRSSWLANSQQRFFTTRVTEHTASRQEETR